ncbi:MAG: hypothetical protein C0511_06455 [Hyphomicrobium sp.]|nr:hypothetical protein [Hyphomicrobium sp.]
MFLRRPSAFIAGLVGVLSIGAAMVLAQPASAHEASAKGVTVVHPWARATPKGAAVGAAYLEIKTDEKTSDRLIGAKSAVAGKVEIHTHIHEGDVMRMRRIDGVDIKAGASHVLRPSGDHVMLMDLKQPLKEGDLLKLTLIFEKAGEIEVDATIEPIGARGPHGLDHQPGHEGSDHSKMDHGKHKGSAGDHDAKGSASGHDAKAKP